MDRRGGGVAAPDVDRGGGTAGSPPRGVLLRLGLLAVVLAAAAVVALVVGVPEAEALRDDVARLGPLAPAAFALVYAAATLAPLPRNVLTAAAGLLFGFVPGLFVVLPGAMLGALAAFGLGRLLGREAVERFTGTRVARVDALLAHRGFVAILGARLIPVLPFTGVNYAAGLTAVRFRSYVLGTAVGIVPGAVAYLALGAHGTSPTSWPFVAAAVALLVLSLGGALLAHRRVRDRTGSLGHRAGRAPG